MTAKMKTGPRPGWAWVVALCTALSIAGPAPNAWALLLETPQANHALDLSAEGYLLHLLAAAFSPVQSVVRNVYPLSVIPGGAYSVAELRAHAQADPVVNKSLEQQAKRLKDPKLKDHLVPRVLPQPAEKHTQLREGDELSWTDRPVTVGAGETVFVHEPSGELLVRARCGNVMVDTVPASGVRRPPPSEEPAPEVVEVLTPEEPVVEVLSKVARRLPPALLEESVLPPPAPDALPVEVAGLPPDLGPIAGLPPLLPPVAAVPVGIGPGVPGVTPIVPAIPVAAAGVPLWPLGALPLVPFVPGVVDGGHPTPGSPQPSPPPGVPSPPGTPTPSPSPEPPGPPLTPPETPPAPPPPQPPSPPAPPTPPPPAAPPTPPSPPAPPLPPPPPAPVPEPASWLLMAICAGGIALTVRGYRRRRPPRRGG